MMALLPLPTITKTVIDYEKKYKMLFQVLVIIKFYIIYN